MVRSAFRRLLLVAAALAICLAAAAESFELPPVAPQVPVPAATPPIRLERVAFVGNTVVPSAELEVVAQDLIGRRVGAAEIEDLRQRLTKHYVERGYVNSGALVDSISATSGAITFRIVEGRLGAIRLRGLDGLDESYVVGRLVRDDDGPFNIDVLRERFQLLLGDPLFARVNARLVPGSRPAEAILDVELTRARTWQLTAFVDNSRPSSLGSNAIGLRGWLRNATGRGDLIEAVIDDSPTPDSAVHVSIGARLPLNPRGTLLTGLYERGRSVVVEEPLDILGITSTLETAEVGLVHPLVATLGTSLLFGASAAARENRTWLLGEPFSFVPGEPEGRVRTSACRFWQELALGSQVDAFVARSTFVWVRTNLREDAEVPTASQPDRRYAYWLGQASYTRQVLDNRARLILRATLQQTQDRLLTLDSMPIGGAHTVRGFRENEVVRDRARILGIELEWPLLRDLEPAGQLSIAPFYDYGHGSNVGSGDVTLSSVGLAAHLRWAGWSANVAVARRLVRPPDEVAARHGLQGRGVHFDVAYTFD